MRLYISLLFKSKFKKYVNIVKNTKNFIWSKISNEILNSDSDLCTCGIYIPHEKSKYFDTEIFEELENDIVLFSPRGNVILLGDFNARTGKSEDYISNEGSAGSSSEKSFQPLERQNFDLTISNHGK